MGNKCCNFDFLFSIDLEDIRLRLSQPDKYKARVPENTYKYLEWLNFNKQKCTFFVTGNVANLYPTLIGEIVSEGHEIACHSDKHIPIDRLTVDEFKKDLDNNMHALAKAGVAKIKGYRAPVFSITSERKWVYDILSEFGFTYSSSVLPAKNPLYGWDDFGCLPKQINNKIFEIPITVEKFGPISVPVAGGVYFRLLPFFFIKSITKGFKKDPRPIVGYFHPYDIDTGQEKFMHPDINGNHFFNFLLYYNRGKVFERLNYFLGHGFNICTYSGFVKNNLKHEI
jgi:polysaccharide deacetylase family protein (PEP-CTERM system associated)